MVRAKPFTVRLLYKTTNHVQASTLGVDSGYENIGFSAVSDKKELICGEAKLLRGMTERMKEKRTYRRQRRNRLRHRKKRFDNRRRSEGWLAPSVQHKLDSHFKLIERLKAIIPVRNVIVEVANFDIQKIRNPEISGADYQQGEQEGFWNLREYILHRDNHKCQNPHCKNKDKSPILQVHHIGYWKGDRTDRPGNLITLCSKCHTPANHKPKKLLHDWEPKIKPFKPATFMSIVRWRLVNELEGTHTYGHVTKSRRIALGIEKTHANDAFAIAGGGSHHERIEPVYLEQVRRNNRSLEKFYDSKVIDIRTGDKVSGTDLPCGRRTRNKNVSDENLRRFRGEKLSKGQRRIRRQRYAYQPKDLVVYEGKAYAVKGVQNKRAYIKLDGLAKPVKTSLVTPKEYRKGMCVI